MTPSMPVRYMLERQDETTEFNVLLGYEQTLRVCSPRHLPCPGSSTILVQESQIGLGDAGESPVRGTYPPGALRYQQRFEDEE